MRAISFAWTTPAVLADKFTPELPAKCVTRRDWKPSYAASFKPGEILSAWTRQPRFGGEKFGTVSVIAVTQELVFDVDPETDWRQEGFGMLSAIGATFEKGYGASDVWRHWRLGIDSDGWNEMYTVCFALVSINEVGERIWRELEAKHGENLLLRPDAPEDGPALTRWREFIGRHRDNPDTDVWESEAGPLLNSAHAENYKARGGELCG
ncbi:hypothetical protein EON79_02615 [bacterium]|nr:MAG: hypothetical protein EON79_02615 [bacterium]